MLGGADTSCSQVLDLAVSHTSSVAVENKPAKQSDQRMRVFVKSTRTHTLSSAFLFVEAKFIHGDTKFGHVLRISHRSQIAAVCAAQPMETNTDAVGLSMAGVQIGNLCHNTPH